MAVAESTSDLRIGEKAPGFTLKDVYGKEFSMDKLACKDAFVVMFLCAHCPYVQALEDRIVELSREMKTESVQFVGICANDSEKYPDDSPENLRKRAEEKGYPFPYLIDESQQVAKDYGAACTPEFYVFDQYRKLAYHGRFDDNWKEPEKVERHELRDAIYNVLKGKAVSQDQKPSMGCSIKWKE